MRKIFSVMVVGVLLLVYACGGGGDDPKSVMSDYFDVMDKFVADAEKCESADDVVNAINNFSESMQKLVPRMKAVQEKHPELKTMKDGNLPDEFKEFEPRLKEMMPKFMGVFAKIGKFGTDPKVQEAQKKLQEAMSAL